MIVKPRLVYSILFYVLIMILIFVSKPSLMFEKNKVTDTMLKPFGVGRDKTLFSFGVFAVVVAILSFYLFCSIDLVFGA
jgi:hypothetical protein